MLTQTYCYTEKELDRQIIVINPNGAAGHLFNC